MAATFKEFVFPAYARMASGRRKRRRRTQNTDRGRLLQTGTVICAALGLDTDLNLIYQLFALLLALLVISRVSLVLARPHVTVHRQLPRYATADEPFTYSIVVTNTGDNLEADLRLIDSPENRVPTLEEFRLHREPGEETRNAYDRWIGFHRFMWLLRNKTGIVTRSAEAPDIAIRSRVAVPVEASPLRRGVVTFRAIQVLHPDPMGFSWGVIEFPDRETLTILPKRYPVSARFHLPGGRHFQPGGVNSTWSIGESDEFVSLRDYREGDSMRRIHWSSSAKRAKPVVKEFQEEYLVRQALVLETETDDMFVLEEAVSLAASLLLQESDSDSMLDLIYYADQAHVISSGHGADSINRQLEALASIGPSVDELESLADVAQRHAGEYSGCLLILTGWDDARAGMVDRIRASGVATVVMIVTRQPDAIAAPTGAHVLDAGNMADAVARL